MRNPTWSRDELIVTLDFYMRHSPKIPGKTSSEVIELSRLLNRLGQQIAGDKSETFRNPNGVYMKLMNFRRFDPDYLGSGLERGGKDEEVVWNLFANNTTELSKTASSIADFVTVGTQGGDGLDPLPDIFDFDAEEGKVLTRQHQVRERNKRLVERKKQQVMSQTGQLCCEVCGFDFSVVYGELGQDFLECHHNRPVSELRPGERTSLTDLSLLCANCHRMIHRRRPWISVEELRKMLKR